MGFEADKTKMRWILSIPVGEHCVGITQWRDMVLIATDAGNIYQVLHDEVMDNYKLDKVSL